MGYALLREKAPLGEKTPKPSLQWVDGVLTHCRDWKKYAANDESASGYQYITSDSISVVDHLPFAKTYRSVKESFSFQNSYRDLNRLTDVGDVRPEYEFFDRYSTYSYVNQNPIIGYDPNGLVNAAPQFSGGHGNFFSNPVVPINGPKGPSFSERVLTCRTVCNLGAGGAACGAGAALCGASGPGAFAVFAVCRVQMVAVCELVCSAK